MATLLSNYRRMGAFRYWVLLAVILAVVVPGLLLWPRSYRQTAFLMGTRVEVVAYGPQAKPAAAAALEEIRRLAVLLGIGAGAHGLPP